MLYQLLHKVIQTGVGRSRFIMAGIGLAIALLLILAAVQVQVNYNQLLYGNNNKDSIANFLVISKEIDGNKVSNTLSNEELTSLKAQPFAEAVGKLTASRFKVSAQSPSDRLPFYTELFFESVPDTFIDVSSKDWKWEEGSDLIPMVIPNQFLDLYNFGFAPSQNLGQLTREMVMSVPVIINIQSQGRVIPFRGRVAGFSDRIASVLVPQNFLDWANKNYGTQQQAQPSRVVIKTSDPSDPALTAYLQKNRLVTDADKTRFSKYRQIVNVIVGVSWVTGAVMLAFALLVFSLFIQLTTASAKNEISLLVTLGASPRQLQNFLLKQFFPVNIIITICCLLAIAVLQWLLHRTLEKQQMRIDAVPSVYTLASAVIVLLVLWVVNMVTTKKYIKATA